MKTLKEFFDSFMTREEFSGFINGFALAAWSERDLEEFEKLCAPLVEFIQQRHDKCNPYSWIIIQWNGVAFMPDSFWFPFKVPD